MSKKRHQFRPVLILIKASVANWSAIISGRIVRVAVQICGVN